VSRGHFQPRDFRCRAMPSAFVVVERGPVGPAVGRKGWILPGRAAGRKKKKIFLVEGERCAGRPFRGAGAFCRAKRAGHAGRQKRVQRKKRRRGNTGMSASLAIRAALAHRCWTAWGAQGKTGIFFFASFHSPIAQHRSGPARTAGWPGFEAGRGLKTPLTFLLRIKRFASCGAVHHLREGVCRSR